MEWTTRLNQLALGCCLVLLGCTNDPTANHLKQVPRHRTLITDCAENNTCGSQIQDYESFNPFVPGGMERWTTMDRT